MNFDSKIGVGMPAPEWDQLAPLFRPGLIAKVRGLVSHFDLPAEGLAYVRLAAQGPSRHVAATAKSMAAAYASDKMGTSIGVDSKTLELPAALTCEADEETVAFFNQTPPLKVEFIRDGRKRAHQQTPDFLVIRRTEALLVEGKSLSAIALRNAKDPGHYVKEGRHWACPSLQVAARKLGMRHEVWTEDSFSPIKLRNLRMLVDYMAAGSCIEGYDAALASMRQVLDVEPRIDIERLLERLRDQICVDHVYAAIAKRGISFDLESAPLQEQYKCFVYRDDQRRDAFKEMERAKISSRDRIVGSTVEIAAGSDLQWDGVAWSCLNLGTLSVTLLNSKTLKSLTLPKSTLQSLIDAGTVTASSEGDPASGHDDEVLGRVTQASEKDLRTGNLRHRRIAQFLVAGARAPAGRTDRRHLAQYRYAEAAFGNGYIGLLPGFSKSGNRTPRLIQAVLDIAVRHVNENYLTAKNLHKKAVFMLVAADCNAVSLPPPSYSWFCRYIDKLPAHGVALSRKGTRGAYALEAPVVTGDNVDKMEPERAMERGHVDHTELDGETLFEDTSERAGKVWCTLLIDQFSKRCLSHYLTYDAPSYRSILMVLRKCVQRFGRLPEAIVCDGGRDMRCTYFETACALYRVTIIWRPIAKSRYGATVERMFGTVNTNLIHCLAGNTQLRRTDLRQITEAVDPNTHSVWTLPALNKELSEYLYETYDTLPHRKHVVTPRFAFESSMERHGQRPQRRVLFNDLFRITTSPSTPKGTSKVTREGCKINYLWYYHGSLSRHIGKQLKVRYDPFDLSIAWVFVDRSWLRLKTRHQGLLRNLSEHELDLAVTEWRKRRSDVEKERLTDAVLVKFLQRVMKTETLLLERRRANELRRLREAENDFGDYDDEDDTDASATDPSQPAADSDEPAAEPSRTPSSEPTNTPTPPLPKPKTPKPMSGFAKPSAELKTLEVTQ